MSFEHETLALTWQPGFCANNGVEEGCQPDQPHGALIGLHGLWPSEPLMLEQNHVPVTKWWAQGCSLLVHRIDEIPVLDRETQQELALYMPHTKQALLVHEWNKHAHCFFPQADVYFRQALALRKRFAQSRTGLWLVAHQGEWIDARTVLQIFAHDEITRPAGDRRLPQRALQLRCAPISLPVSLAAGAEAKDGTPWGLTQLWFTLDPHKLDIFPRKESFLPSPQNQGNCPARFWLPPWPQTEARGEVSLRHNIPGP